MGGREQEREREKREERRERENRKREKLVRVKERRPVWACLGGILLVVYKVLS